MNGKYRLFFLILTIIILWKCFNYFSVFERNEDIFNVTENDEIQKLKISVHYEALCPDSKFFVNYQLLPTYDAFKDYLIVDFIPYGKATTHEVDGKYMFNCQHEAVECFANKIHACAIDLVKDPSKQVKYIACMINDNMIPDDAGEKCGQELNIDYIPIGECANSDRGSELLKEYGDRTHSLNPSVKFIPTIEINNSQNIVPQSAILKDLKQSICQVFKQKPKRCG